MKVKVCITFYQTKNPSFSISVKWKKTGTITSNFT